MKKILITALCALSLAASAHALVVGASAGYLLDAEEEYFSVRIGQEISHANSLSHQIELELGYTEQKDSGIKGEFYPLTLNYRLVNNLRESVSYHVGVGAGVAFTDVSGFGVSDNDSSFAAQAFAGAEYHLTPAASVEVGVKYIWIDDVKLFGTKVDVGDDVAISLGLNFKF